MKTKFTLSLSILVTFCLLICQSSSAQMYPLSLDQRVTQSSIIAIVKVTGKESYWDDKKANVWTRNMMVVKAYIKGSSSATNLVALSRGGVVGNHAEYVCPAETYVINQEYFVLLNDDNNTVDDKSYRVANPGVKQCVSYAAIESVFPYESGTYKDALTEPPMTEQQLLDRLDVSYGLKAKRPDGAQYQARVFNTPVTQGITSVTGITDGTGSTPAAFVNGTIAANNELIINGSGFGAATGTVQFPDINSGGSGTVNTVSTVDIISWTNTQIRTKIPDNAGSGTFTVLDNGNAPVGSFPITIKWGEINVTSTFLNFSTAQRQQVHLLDRNGAGGYTFQFSSNTTNGPAFSADAAAKLAFDRVVRTWRCNSLVNFNVSPTPSALGYAADNTNIVMYDNVGLPPGALGVCTSRFNASGVTGFCELANTVWYLQEMDIQVLSVPVPTYTWNFTTSAPTSSQFDFESVMLHEVGHGVGLSHINLSTTLMFWSIANGEMKRVPSANEIQAAQYRIAQSNTNCLWGFGVTSFAPHTAINPASCNTLLPLSLLDFSGQKRLNVIDLKWITEMETNTKGFYVERSTDGQHYNSLGFVTAAGGVDKHTYNFTDNAGLAPGVVYYRLRITDIDNSSRYSNIIQFKTEGGHWNVFPNPVSTDKLFVVADKPYAGKAMIEIVDLAGRRVHAQEEGSLNPGTAIPVSINNLSAGIYILKVIQADQLLLVQKFTKQ